MSMFSGTIAPALLESPMGQFVLRSLGLVLKIDESQSSSTMSMPTHFAGDLLIVGAAIAHDFTPAGWNNRISLTSGGGNIGFFWKIATSGVETLAIPNNANNERGHFLQAAVYKTPSDASQAEQQAIGATSLPDDGVYVRAGIVEEAFTDTLLMIVGTKVGVTYNPDPPGSASVGILGPFQTHAQAFESEWEAGAERFTHFYYGQLFESVSDAIANGTVTQTPALFTQDFDGVGSGSKTIRFRIP